MEEVITLYYFVLQFEEVHIYGCFNVHCSLKKLETCVYKIVCNKHVL